MLHHVRAILQSELTPILKSSYEPVPCPAGTCVEAREVPCSVMVEGPRISVYLSGDEDMLGSPVKRSGFRLILVVIPALVIGSWPPSAIRGAPPSDREVLKLWPGGTPDAKGIDPDKDVPTLTAWLP